MASSGMKGFHLSPSRVVCFVLIGVSLAWPASATSPVRAQTKTGLHGHHRPLIDFSEIREAIPCLCIIIITTMIPVEKKS
jgi:hypothetical protein